MLPAVSVLQQKDCHKFQRVQQEHVPFSPTFAQEHLSTTCGLLYVRSCNASAACRCTHARRTPCATAQQCGRPAARNSFRCW